MTTPGGGTFHAVAYSVEGQTTVVMEMVPPGDKVVNQIRRVLDVRKNLAAAGEMTNSVQMLLSKFNQFCLIEHIVSRASIAVSRASDWWRSCRTF